MFWLKINIKTKICCEESELNWKGNLISSSSAHFYLVGKSSMKNSRAFCFHYTLDWQEQMKSRVFWQKGQSCHHSATVSDVRKVEMLPWTGISGPNQWLLNPRVVSLGLLKGQILSDRESCRQAEAVSQRSSERMQQTRDAAVHQLWIALRRDRGAAGAMGAEPYRTTQNTNSWLNIGMLAGSSWGWKGMALPLEAGIRTAVCPSSYIWGLSWISRQVRQQIPGQGLWGRRRGVLLGSWFGLKRYRNVNFDYASFNEFWKDLELI